MAAKADHRMRHKRYNAFGNSLHVPLGIEIGKVVDRRVRYKQGPA
jgi:hypothetical protein